MDSNLADYLTSWFNVNLSFKDMDYINHIGLI